MRLRNNRVELQRQRDDSHQLRLGTPEKLSHLQCHYQLTVQVLYED